MIATLLELFVETYAWMFHDLNELHADPHPGVSAPRPAPSASNLPSLSFLPLCLNDNLCAACLHGSQPWL